MRPARTRPWLIVVVLAISAALFAIGWRQILIDTDVVASLPQHDPVIRDAVHIFKNHPFQDQLTIDVGLDRSDPDQLVRCAQAVEIALRESGLFRRVGMEDMALALPELMQSVVKRLPVLFTARELEQKVVPLLAPERVEARLRQLQQSLLQMDGIGQAEAISQDPLGLKDLVLAKLLFLVPTQSARVYQGQVISANDRHLLLTAVPVASGTDTAFAGRLSEFLAQLNSEIGRRFAAQGLQVTLTPVGAYRAALDNEVIVRGDINMVLLFSSLGVALLLLLAFPRPWVGLLSLLPAVVGTLMAFFVYALLRPSISVMVLGFGGAIISITVDQGITYLLFLDRPSQSFGRQASHEVWSVGLLAVLTTLGAFGALMLSDFVVFQELGLFSALGIGFSFLFVHWIFPLIFPSMPPSRERRLPLPRLADRFFSLGGKGAIAAAVLFGVLLCFARPDFNVNLSAMNTVSEATQAAEKTLTTVWGDIFNKVFLMTEAKTLAQLQENNDRLLTKMADDDNGALLSRAFLPSMVFPGAERRSANLAAWRSFWQPARVEALAKELRDAGIQAGFTSDAFASFFSLLRHPDDGLLAASDIPEALMGMMGISQEHGSSQMRQFATLTLPSGYTGRRFYDHYHELARVFDPALFSKQLGHMMFTTFAKLLIIVAPVVILLLLFFFLDLSLTLIALAPIVFALVCSLGTLKLLGRPLDIPALLLGVIVIGMGIDYSLFIVRAFQRYGRADHPAFTLIRSAVLMTSGSTLIGFGVLAMARHALLRSAGISLSLGIGYSVIGAFLILPPLLGRYLQAQRSMPPTTTDLARRVRARYRRMEPNARMFARFKLRLDPMFAELPAVLPLFAPPRVLLDIGTGFGVPACWLAETYPGVQIYGIEPDEERVRVSSRALGGSGTVVCGAAPELPPAPPDLDGAFMLDMMHYLDDEALGATLARVRALLALDAPLVIRAVMQPTQHPSWYWWVDQFKNRVRGIQAFFRSEEQISSLLGQSGFKVEKIAPSGSRGELMWVCARKDKSSVRSL